MQKNVVLPGNNDHTDFIIETDLFQRDAKFAVTAGLGCDVILVVDQHRRGKFDCGAIVLPGDFDGFVFGHDFDSFLLQILS